MQSSVQLLPAGSDVLIRADIDSNRELIGPVLAMFSNLPPDFSEEFIERTDTVWAGLDFSGAETSGPVKSSVIAEGDYPKTMMELGLCWNKEWKKQKYSSDSELRINIPYWYEKNGTNQLAFPSDKVFLASSGEIEDMINLWTNPSGEVISPYWLESEKTADVTIMTRNISPEGYAVFVPEFKKVPLESLILSLERDSGAYLISGRFCMDSEVSAFLFAALFRTMVITVKNGDGNKVFENPREIIIKKDGSDVVLGGMRLPVSNVVAVETLWLGNAGLK